MTEPTPNRTVLRHQVLKAVDSGELTILRYISLTPAATRTLTYLEGAGLVESAEGIRFRQLTAAGKELIRTWNDQVRFGIGNADV